MKDDVIRLEDLRRVALRPGDVVVARVSRETTMNEASELLTSLKWAFADHRCVVICGVVDLFVAGDEDVVRGKISADLDGNE